MLLSHERKPREALLRYAAEALADLYAGEPVASPYAGGRSEALRRLEALDLAHYQERHNAVDEGATSGLSPYIRHGLLSPGEVLDSVVRRFGVMEARGFVLQLLWRVYCYLRYREPAFAASLEPMAGNGRPGDGDGSQEDAGDETVKLSGLRSSKGIRRSYGLYCMDESLRQLRATGFLAFPARLWVASYLLHWEGIDWREGYRLFQEHLIDADPVVNALWWMWVRGDITGKPYLATRERVAECTRGEYCARCAAYRCPLEEKHYRELVRVDRAGGAER